MSDETYAVRRTDADHPSPFATVREASETTVVVEQGEVDVSVFVVSSYATDHVSVKEADLPAAVRRLEELGCEVDG